MPGPGDFRGLLSPLKGDGRRYLLSSPPSPPPSPRWLRAALPCRYICLHFFLLMVVVVVVYRCPPSFLLMVSVVVGGRGGLRVGALHGCYARVGGG